MPDPSLSLESVHDVVIAGGGLAGLTLALQLRGAMPELDIRVLERRAGPAPAAAHKIGESSVEIGAHYFAETLGLRAHLDECHLRKFGFRFFFSDGRDDLTGVTELGASRFMSTPSWQIDRGVFENFLEEEVVRRGARVDTGTIVRRIALAEGRSRLPSDDLHRIEIERDGVRSTIGARWLVDASGRAGLLKRKLGLAEDNGHDANAVWFRLSHRLEIDKWVADHGWRQRCSPAARWMSTNHLCGEGYWLWLIPLGSGAHSVGIVADAKTHPLASMDTFERAMDWIATHQPSVHDAIARMLGDDPDALMDFPYFKDFSNGCKQTFSAERWALTGEAGWFLDPFYSPGADFIAIGNTFTTDLIRAERAGQPIRSQSLFFGELFRSFYESTLTLYQDQYALFGNERVMPVKVLWDYTYYWGVLCQLFFQERLTDRAMITRLEAPLKRAKDLNERVQSTLRDWGRDAKDASHPTGTMLDQASLPWFAELNRGLRDRLDDAAFEQRIVANVAQLATLADEIAAMAAADRAPRTTQPTGTLPASLLFGIAA